MTLFVFSNLALSSALLSSAFFHKRPNGGFALLDRDAVDANGKVVEQEAG
jgi:hypothetical protein